MINAVGLSELALLLYAISLCIDRHQNLTFVLSQSSRTILSLRGGLHESKRSITEYRLSATVGGFTKSSTPWCSRHQNSPVDVLVLDPQPVVYTDSQGSSFYMQAKIGLRVSVESA